MFRWIPVEEQLPKKDDRYLGLHQSGECIIVWYWTDYKEWETASNTWDVDQDIITHWAPIQWPPELPKEAADVLLDASV